MEAVAAWPVMREGGFPRDSGYSRGVRRSIFGMGYAGSGSGYRDVSGDMIDILVSWHVLVYRWAP